MAHKKCCETVFDTITKRNRKCKLNRHFREYCYIHAQISFKDYTTLIQRIWRGFYTRKKIKTLFYNLPRELQYHVMKYVRIDHYIEKHWIPSILKVYKNRLFQGDALKKDLFNLYDTGHINENEYYDSMYKLVMQQKQVQIMIDTFTDK